ITFNRADLGGPAEDELLRIEGEFMGGRRWSKDARVSATSVDVTAPSISCGAGAAPLEATAQITVVRGVATATDDCDPTPQVIYQPAALSYVFPESAQTVEAYAKDASGNSSGVCTVAVTLEDRTPPTIAIASPAGGGAYILNAV